MHRQHCGIISQDSEYVERCCINLKDPFHFAIRN